MRSKMKYVTLALFALPLPVIAGEVDIVGNVEAKCIIQTDTSGVYGNPTADKLSTTPADSGVEPVVRYDVAVANYYLAKITHPTSFSSSPTLTDTVAWAGSTAVSNTSDALMSAYDTNKITYDSTTQFDLTVAGSTWFKTSSTATYGVSKAFPGGAYTAVVQAECIAK
tara:strand:+ start:220 stop:723 length:504 start_codon:yes stop_codon:yes gene_type:complete